MKARVKRNGRNIEVVLYCSTVRGDMFECLSTGERYFHDELELEDEYYESDSGKAMDWIIYKP
jgi:hypothetical protein